MRTNEPNINKNTKKKCQQIKLDRTISLSERTFIPERMDAIRLRRHKIELTMRLRRTWDHIVTIAKDKRNPTNFELERAAFKAGKDVPSKTMKRNVARRRQRQRKHKLAKAE